MRAPHSTAQGDASTGTRHESGVIPHFKTRALTARARVRCLQFPIPPAAARDFDAAQMIHVYHRRFPVSSFLAVCVLQIAKQMPTRVQVKTLTHMKETLGHNVSSLYKTAVSEIQRKDTQIKDLNARQVSLPARAEQKGRALAGPELSESIRKHNHVMHCLRRRLMKSEGRLK